MTNETIAVLGLGAMGGRMARRLLDAGFSVRVYNRTPARAQALAEHGAVVCPTPRDAASGAGVVLSVVRDDDASRDVWLDPHSGAGLGMETSALAVECSTLSPAAVEQLGGALAKRGVALLDAPVVGSRPQAEAGTLVFLVGGGAEALATLGPAFEALGSAVHHVGSLGRGTAMKLAVNALLGIQVAALAEWLGALSAADIAPAHAMEVLGTLVVTSPAAKGIGGLMVTQDHEPRFPVDLVHKDLGYAADAAKQWAATVPMSAAAREVFARARAKGLGPQNLAAVERLYR